MTATPQLLPTADAPTADEVVTTAPSPDARLATVLRTAAQLPLDHLGWDRLTAEARSVTAALASEGRVPAHLVVGAHDPPALVTRSLAAAWRHVTDVPVRRA